MTSLIDFAKAGTRRSRNSFNLEVDEELAQCRVRLILTAAIASILGLCSLIKTLRPGEQLPVAATVVLTYFLFSCLWCCWVSRRPTKQSWRKLVMQLADLLLTLLGMFLLGPFGGAFYPFVLWIIIDFGMRFGSTFLFTGMAGGLSGFIVLSIISPYWQQNLPTAMGLMLGIVVLPLFYLTLLRRLHRLNKRLAGELARTAHAATHDTLTDLANREYFFEKINDELKRIHRHGGGFAVLFIDLDGFKQINDNYGHQEGDRILVEVAGRLRELARKSDWIARLGGDEFSLLLHGATRPEVICRLAQNIILRLAEPYALSSGPANISASVGISLCPSHGDSVQELIRAADHAMYRAKAGGKNAFVLYDPSLDSEDVSLLSRFSP